MYVVPTLRRPLLGRPAIEALGLVQRIAAVGEVSKLTKRFPKLFNGLGKLAGEYHIRIREGAQPYSLLTPRRVAIPLLTSVRKELTRMEELGVIFPVNQPTDWCAGMVVVPKANGKVRICVDLTKLNESVCRERHLLPSVEQTLGQIAGAKIFTKLDANSGFWQIPLSRESALVTTFITPFGRFCFKRLPFGISSAPEHFQRRMSTIQSGLPGVVCQTDDILVHGRSEEEHDQHLKPVMERLEKAGITLNLEKCQFSPKRVKFLGQVINQSGVRPDPDKVSAVAKMKPPTNTTELRRFLGMTNQLSKFAPQLAEKTKPLRDLLSKRNEWRWGDQQEQAFIDTKTALSSTPVLVLYDPSRPTIVNADAFSYGLGAVLIQQQPSGEQRPVAYN